MPMSRTCSRKSFAKDRIAVAQEVARELGKGKCLAQLLSGPICGRVGGHIEVQDATPVMGQHQKYVKDLEPDGGHGEEVQEGAPSLRRRFAAAHHIFADTALSDVDAEFEQFAVDPWCTPTGILPAHLANQISDFA